MPTQLNSNRDSIASTAVDLHYKQHPEFETRYGPSGREKCYQDALLHLDYLETAIEADQPDLFASYVEWASSMLTARDISVDHLGEHLRYLVDAAEQIIEDEQEIARIQECVEKGLQALHAGRTLPSFLPSDEPFGELSKQYLGALLDGARGEAVKMIREAVNEGLQVEDIYLKVFEPVQHEVGRLWQLNKISVAQEHFCTAATQFVMSQLYDNILAGERNGRTAVGACISGDLHEIGLRMVMDLLEMNGWHTVYLGANTPLDGILEMIEKTGASLLAVSATITPHVGLVKELINDLRADSKFDHVKIIVGGYPFNIEPTLWRRIGADTFARSAADTVESIASLTD